LASSAGRRAYFNVQFANLLNGLMTYLLQHPALGDNEEIILGEMKPAAQKIIEKK
jgi:hypothetical protein